MKKYYSILLISLTIGCNNNPSQTEKEYIKNLEEKNAALEKELQEKKDKSQGNLDESTKPSSNYFTIGSTENEVLEIMGDPESYRDVGVFKMFIYGRSTITFENDRVKSYDNSDGNLKVRVRK
ncbi:MULTISPECIES: hypothetical protein [unclassified Flavobacterium]|uniref:hypothetical protein n=1 Tax=unclassified Flavobacterium TaxID=196869 RepID=UPI0036229ABE